VPEAQLDDARFARVHLRKGIQRVIDGHKFPVIRPSANAGSDFTVLEKTASYQ
jgi:hypothetical protein